MSKVIYLSTLFTILSTAAFAQLPKGDRTFAWHLEMAENNSYDSAVFYANEACLESVHQFFPWTSLETAPGVFDQQFISNVLDLYELYYPAVGLPLELQIAPVNTNVLEVPSDLAALPMNHPTTVNRFKTLLDTVFAHIPNVELEALMIGNESDIYFGTDANKYNEFAAFLDSVAPYAKQLYFSLHGEDLKIGTTLTHEGLTDPSTAALCQIMNANMDVVSLTYYPLGPGFTMEDPSAVFNDFNDLVAQYPDTTQPIYFVECGYSSSTVINGSDQKQADFFHNVFEAWDTHYDNIKYLTIFMLTDWSQATVDTLANYYNIQDIAFKEYLRTLGVRTWDVDGSSKPAYYQIQCELADRNWCNVNCSGLNLEDKTTGSIQVLPNPANHQFELTLGNVDQISFDLISMDGKIVKQVQDYTGGSISIENMDSGSYYLQLSNGEVHQLVIE